MEIRKRLRIFSGSSSSDEKYVGLVILSSCEGKYYKNPFTDELVDIREEFNKRLLNLRDEKYPDITMVGSTTMTYTSPQIWYWPVHHSDYSTLDEFLTEVSKWDLVSSFAEKYGTTSIATQSWRHPVRS